MSKTRWMRKGVSFLFLYCSQVGIANTPPEIPGKDSVLDGSLSDLRLAEIQKDESQTNPNNPVPPLSLPLNEESGQNKAITTRTFPAGSGETASKPQQSDGKLAQKEELPAPQPSTGLTIPSDATSPLDTSEKTGPTKETTDKELTGKEPTSKEISTKDTLGGKDITTKDTLNLPSLSAENESNSLWQSLLFVTGALAVMGGLGVVLVKFKNKGAKFQGQPEKAMQIVATLPISPKRQLLLVRIRDEEIVISSTEQGISMLSSLGTRKETTKKEALIASVVEKANFLPQYREEAPRAIEKKVREEPFLRESRESDENPNKKSDLLLKALSGIKGKAQAAKSETTQAPAPAKATAATPSLSKPPSFQKYLTKAFEDESKRELPVKTQTPQAEDSGGFADHMNPNSEDTVESVTKMIREKLRKLQPEA